MKTNESWVHTCRFLWQYTIHFDVGDRIRIVDVYITSLGWLKGIDYCIGGGETVMGFACRSFVFGLLEQTKSERQLIKREIKMWLMI